MAKWISKVSRSASEVSGPGPVTEKHCRSGWILLWVTVNGRLRQVVLFREDPRSPHLDRASDFGEGEQEATIAIRLECGGGDSGLIEREDDGGRRHPASRITTTAIEMVTCQLILPSLAQPCSVCKW